MADALTSLLAIIALIFGKRFGWICMDPIMGIVGAILISRWSYSLLRDTSKILLDRGVEQEKISTIISTIELDSDNRISDIHIWPLGLHQFAAIISVVTNYPKPPEYYKELLTGFKELKHVTVEVNQVACDPHAWSHPKTPLHINVYSCL